MGERLLTGGWIVTWLNHVAGTWGSTQAHCIQKIPMVPILTFIVVYKHHTDIIKESTGLQTCLLNYTKPKSVMDLQLFYQRVLPKRKCSVCRCDYSYGLFISETCGVPGILLLRFLALFVLEQTECSSATSTFI